MKKIKIKNILKKKGKTPIVCLTAYSKSVAEILDKYCDIILVGDSVGMALYGMQSTKQIKLDTMILHAKAVRKFAKRSLVVLIRILLESLGSLSNPSEPKYEFYQKASCACIF